MRVREVCSNCGSSDIWNLYGAKGCNNCGENET